MQNWCKAYLDWLVSSEEGKEESVHPNNHGTWYDVQAGALAIFTKQHEIARTLFEKAKMERLDAHILEDGSQPRELTRTRSWNYSSMNLWGLFQLASLAKQTDIDLWNYPTPEQSQLRKALDYLLPYALGEKDWPHEQITPFDPGSIKPHLALAAWVFDDAKYSQALQRLNAIKPDPKDYSILWQ
jgi:hypothetical protein